LITLRGLRLIESADVIVYAGSLINPELLQTAKPGCELYDSSKMTLDGVIAVMAPTALAGREVVRLHSGDPGLYGTIREQADRLEALGVACEICPGVSSLFAASAALKTGYTLPGVSQTLIITRAAGRTPVPERESIRSLAAHGASMALFLSSGLLKTVAEELLKGGYAPETPAAIVYRASWPQEKILRCTVGTLAACAAQNDITSTALVCAGDFLGGDYELSRLYSADFSTNYRD
jgi:precorrin-4/cobalt-precorrin-4 C11-methyltransferase